jgi:hypothetical protein
MTQGGIVMQKPNENQDSILFDWEAFQKQFAGNGFINDSVKEMMTKGNLSWVDDYVQGIVSRTLPKMSPQTEKTIDQLKANVFETHNFVIARIKVSKQADPRKLRFYVANNQLRVDGLAHDNNQFIQLPANVRFRESRAVFKNGIFEIRMPKEAQKRFKEINVRYL